MIEIQKAAVASGLSVTYEQRAVHCGTRIRRRRPDSAPLSITEIPKLQQRVAAVFKLIAAQALPKWDDRH